MLAREYYDFARQAGCTHVVIHLVDYFNQGPSNPRDNQPTGGRDQPWGVAGDPERLWTTAELKQTDKGFEWGFEDPTRGTKVRYVMTVTDKGEWHEVGDYSQDGKTWTRFFEMTLTKAKEK